MLRILTVQRKRKLRMAPLSLESLPQRLTLLGASYALTDSRPEENGPRTMTICPAFWDAEWAEVNRLLPMLPNEGEKPDPNLYDQWCKIEDEDWKAITPNYRTFVTPG